MKHTRVSVFSISRPGREGSHSGHTMKAVQGKDGAQMFQLTELKDEFMARTSEAFGSVDLRQKLSASLSPFQSRES